MDCNTTYQSSCHAGTTGYIRCESLSKGFLRIHSVVLAGTKRYFSGANLALGFLRIRSVVLARTARQFRRFRHPVMAGALLLVCLLPQQADAQEIRTGLEYEYKSWERIEWGAGLELRHQESLDIRPDKILLSLSAKYAFNKHWKAGLQGRWKSETDEDAEGLSLMDDQNRYTVDVYYKKKVKAGWGIFQGRFRYQLSEDDGKYEDFYRLRLKWEQRTIRGLHPFLSTEAIFAAPEPVPDACRIRTGMELDLGPRVCLGLFYQLEAMLKEEDEILNYAVGARLTFSK